MDRATFNQLRLSAVRWAAWVLAMVISLLPGPAWPQKGLLVITKGPYLQAPTQNSMVVLWETNAPSDGRVLYGETSALDLVAVCPDRQKLHCVALTGLRSGLQYYYKVVSGGVESEIYAFKTAPGPEAAITFVAYGDNRGGIEKHRIIAGQIRRWNPDFIIHTGDMVFDGRQDRDWTTQFFGPLKDVISRAPIYPTMGNHEALSELYYDYFRPPNGHGLLNRSYYSFDYGPAHFAAVNVYEDYKPGSAQYKWLREDLLRAKDALWRFVFLHFTPFTSGERCFDIETVETRAYLQRLFEDAKVDMVFGGHDHIYERTFPIKGSRRDDVNGVTYIVAAGGGAALYGVDPKWWSAYAESRHNFCVITLQGKELSLEARDMEGDVFDELCISKDGRAIEELKAQLANAHGQDKANIASELGEFADARVVESLLTLLVDSDISVRRAAAHALAASAQPAAVGRIAEMVSHMGDAGAAPPDKEIEQNLAEALARSREPAAILGLVKLADSPDELTRLFAVGGIRWVANQMPSDDLQRQLRHFSPAFRRYAIAALRKIARVVEDASSEGALRDAKRKERLKAVESLRNQADPSNAGPLLDLLRAEWQDQEMRDKILDALGRIDPQKGPQLKAIIMLDAMKSTDWRVRCEIADQLGTLDKRWALLGLIPALDDERLDVRNAAYRRLPEVSGGEDFGRDKVKWQAWYDRWRRAQRAPERK